MADLYVKAGGDGSHTAGYDPTSDNWASAHDSLNDIEAHDAAGDIVRVSHLHDKAYSFSVFLTHAGVTTSEILFISVDDSDGTTYRPGARERISSDTYDLNIDNSGSGRNQEFYGIDFKAGNDFRLALGNTGRLGFHDCNLEMSDTSGSADIFEILDDGGYVVFDNVNLEMPQDVGINIEGGCKLEWIGGSLSAPAALNAPNILFEDSSEAGGYAYIEGVDLSGMASGASMITLSTGTSKDMIQLEMVNCLMPTNYKINAVDPSAFGIYPVELKNCQVGGDVRAGFSYETQHGKAVSVEGSSSGGIHRTDGTVIDTGTYLTAQITTNTYASKFVPFWFKFAARYENDYSSNGSVRVYLASTTSLTDTEFWIECHYQDGTTTGKTNIADSAGKENGFRSPLAAGTALTSDTGSTWMNGSSALTGYNEYYVDCTLTNGTDGMVEVWVYVGDPSITVYVDTEIDFV